MSPFILLLRGCRAVCGEVSLLHEGPPYIICILPLLKDTRSNDLQRYRNWLFTLSSLRRVEAIAILIRTGTIHAVIVEEM